MAKERTQEVFKVVEKGTRWGSNMTMAKQLRDYDLVDIIKFRRTHPQYFPKYCQGRIIKGAKNTSGILTFGEYKDAKYFVNTAFSSPPSCIIIKVLGYGEPSTNARIVPGCGDWPLHITHKAKVAAPHGTLGFMKVKVLE